MSPFEYDGGRKYFARNKTPTPMDHQSRTIDRDKIGYKTIDHSNSQYISRAGQKYESKQVSRVSRFNTPF